MNLKENTNYIGKINLKDVPSGEIDIYLSFSDKGVFFDFHTNSIPNVSYGILTGSLSGYGDFTLINSFQNSCHNNTYKYKSDYLITGSQFQTKESLVFNRYSFELLGLSEWISKKFWVINAEDSIKFEENLYKQDIKIEESVILRISNVCRFNHNYKNYTLDLKGFSFIELISINKDKGFGFDYTFNFIDNLIKFFSFISSRKYKVNNIICFIESQNRSDKNIYSRRFSVYREINDAEYAYLFGELSFQFDEINSILENLLIQWNKKNELLNLIDLNLTFCLNKNSSRNSHFLNAFSCFEGIDKHLNGMKDKAKQRLNRYQSYIEEIYPDSSDLFIKNCLDSRNFFAHGKKNNTEYIFNDFELLYASKTLINISRLLILQELGVPKNLLDDKFNSVATNLKDYMSSNKWYNEGLIEIPKI